MKRSKTIVKFNAADLKVNYDAVAGGNFRQDLDIPSMIREIVQKGRIEEPVHVLSANDVLTLLRGNRRIGAAQEILKDPNCPPDLRKALENVEAFVYTDMDDREATEFILDQGGQKPLNRVEIILACWRLQKMMYSERDISAMLYHQLGRFTGNTSKGYQASQLTGPAREEFLKKWLHGTLGNYILAVGQMGDFIRDQFLLTEMKSFRPLTDEEEKRHVLTVDRSRVGQLTKLKKADKDSAEGWSPDKGGASFNEAVQKWIKEDAGQAEPTTGKKKYTAEQMKQTADTMSSRLGLAFMKCAGELSDADNGKLVAADVEYARLDKVVAILRGALPKVNEPNVAKLIDTILSGQPADVESALVPFVSSGN